MNKLIYNRNGIALPSVIFIFLILFMLGLSILQFSVSDARNTTWQNNRVQSHYLARSGVLIGIDKVQSELNSYEYLGTVQEIATSLNSKFANPYSIVNAGTYTVNFSVTPSNELMISSVGTTTLATPNATNAVTFTKKLTKGSEGLFIFEDASSKWFHTNAFSLAPGVYPDAPSNVNSYDKSFLGRAAKLESTKAEMLNPSVGSPSDASVFRASILAIGEYNGISIEARSNSFGVFDSEIIFINGSIDLSPTDSQITLRVSEPVLKQKTADYNDTYPHPNSWSLNFLNHNNPTGFEDDERYASFTGATLPLANVRGSFDSGVNYGVVRIKSIRDNSSKTILSLPGSSGGYSKGYYYFPNNVRLDLSDGRSSLIPILDSDPITSILDEYFKWRWTDEGLEMWNNK